MQPVRIIHGDARRSLKKLADQSVHCMITSPPYWQLRNYEVDGQIGLEETPQEFVRKLVRVFREARRVLRDDGVLFINIGDSYSSGGRGGGAKQGTNRGSLLGALKPPPGLKQKDRVGIPHMLAFALREDGWYWRDEIVWCLSGATWLYAKTQKGVMPITIKDLARLNPATVKLWNGIKWTQLLGINKTGRQQGIQLVLRSGEMICCTSSHQFPTDRGLIRAGDIRVGDKLAAVRLPEPRRLKDCVIDDDAAWLAGLYIAEGSMSGNKIQISGHANEKHRWRRCKKIAKKFGGSAHLDRDGNNQSIRLYGKVLNAIIKEFVSGQGAWEKGFATVVWNYSDEFVRSMMEGYLSGDGHHDTINKRWRLGFCRNYKLERDIRTACARLGWQLTLKRSHVPYKGKDVPTFKGEIRKTITKHHNSKNRLEVLEIRRSKTQNMYDLGVADAPNTFALASGILTHNSKPNPMPGSATDRCIVAHEYMFMFTKRPRYYYDYIAIMEQAAKPCQKSQRDEQRYKKAATGPMARGTEGFNHQYQNDGREWGSETRIKRSVWTISTEPSREKHYAGFPRKLVLPCILAGTSQKGCCPKCGAPYIRKIKKKRVSSRPDKTSKCHGVDKAVFGNRDPQRHVTSIKTTGWKPGCTCKAGRPIPCTVLDIFGGTGTTAAVAVSKGRQAIVIELNADYVKIIQRKTARALAKKGFGL